MSFRLLGVNVEVQASFLLVTALFGLSGGREDLRTALLWILVVFVSILVHELGHALAILRHKIEPEISLHGMGGTTSWRTLLPMRRRDRAFISFAGPLAGFLLAGLVYAAARLAPSAAMAHPLVGWTVAQMLWVNVGWGLINLAPVLPLDGGHILEQALGPKRARATALVSLFVGVAGAAWGLMNHSWLIVVIFAFGAIHSYMRLSASGGIQPMMPATARTPAPPADEPTPPEIAALLRQARRELEGGHNDRALAMAHDVLELRTPDGKPAPRPAVRDALEIVAWAHLGSERPAEARDALRAVARIGEPDPALGGAVLMASGETRMARRILESARAAGDDRKEVVGPLVQLLLGQGEVTRAAAVAFDVVDSLSDDDVRRMGDIAFEAGVFDWCGRLYEALFQRRKRHEDAYEAARAYAQAGQHDRALELLRLAVDAGFDDRARAWSDAALEALRGERRLEALLPRP